MIYKLGDYSMNCGAQKGVDPDDLYTFSRPLSRLLETPRNFKQFRVRVEHGVSTTRLDRQKTPQYNNFKSTL
jgi:hypothetical protein